MVKDALTRADDVCGRNTQRNGQEDVKIVILAQYYPPEPIPKPDKLSSGMTCGSHWMAVITRFSTLREREPVLVVRGNEE
jgi:hypothetical protein